MALRLAFPRSDTCNVRVHELPEIVMGTVRVEPPLWEAYVEAGGLAFDTAHHYGVESEEAVGSFVERHGIRDRITIVAKGAHSPTCFPEVVAPQLDESLANLGLERVDLYLLHRDNTDVPVGEFADALEREVTAGKVCAVGASNWTSERFEAFNEHARLNGMTPFTVQSNQLSLAEMLKPVWDGCLRADVRWHERTQTPLLAWSAQARGFFAGRCRDDEMEASWISDANLERRRRATALAARRAVAPVTVALAYVLAQPFPASAVIGPRSSQELHDCLAATGVELTADDIGWLDLSTDGAYA